MVITETGDGDRVCDGDGDWLDLFLGSLLGRAAGWTLRGALEAPSTSRRQPTPTWRRASTLPLIASDWSDRRSRYRGFGDHEENPSSISRRLTDDRGAVRPGPARTRWPGRRDRRVRRLSDRARAPAGFDKPAVSQVAANSEAPAGPELVGAGGGSTLGHRGVMISRPLARTRLPSRG